MHDDITRCLRAGDGPCRGPVSVGLNDAPRDEDDLGVGPFCDRHERAYWRERDRIQRLYGV